MADETESSTDASDTYAQIVVPGYDLQDPVVTTTTQTGNSFLRLGSFPALTTTDADLPGFTHSLTLAKLVGDATSVEKSEETDDAAPDSIIKSNSYKGDSNYLLGFADDTRYHGDSSHLTPPCTYVDWTSDFANTTENRQAETARLLTKGGWWDHADGNRISTTSGDKIEVIQGNYKMVVLGRQDPTTTDLKTLAANAFISDSSGGQWIEQDATPTACVMSVEYLQKDNIWTVFQDNGGGNVTTKFEGEQVEYFTGALRQSNVGKEVEFDGSLSRSVDPKKDPVIITKTWAQRIENYIGSNGKPVPSVYTWTHAYAINNVMTAPEITSTNFGFVFETTIGAKTSVLVGPAVELVAGPKLDVGLAKLQFLNLKSVVAAESSEAVALDSKLLALSNRITAVDTRLSGKQQKLNGSVTKLDGDVTSICGLYTGLNDEVTELQTSHTQLAEEVTIMSAGVIVL